MNKAIIERIKRLQQGREMFLKCIKEEGLLEELQWCEREVAKCDFLTSDEKFIYRDALLDAIRWSKNN